jgi:hypothetical protein
MSIEKNKTGKPSFCASGKGCQERTEQPLESAQRSGGVGGDGMLGRADGVTRETCLRGEQAPTPGTTSPKGVTRHDNHVKSGELDFTIKTENLERGPVGI